ncbi:MAG: hypothetical protein JST09_16430 [Bacteroidetes bacterium]|nr:hypothetical protein [Bacteroidota bacterium]MBS1607747.1 hypothetical protein [Bacteroidota bacterium]
MKQSFLLLLLFCLFCTGYADAQQSFLFLKKKGHKKRIWTEGDVIRLRLVNDDLLEGRILLLRNDSIYINDLAFRTEDVKQVIVKRKEKKPFPISGLQALYIAGGVGLSTVGMKTAGWTESYGRALWYSSIIGFGPVLLSAAVQHMNLRRTHFNVGKKFRLQVLDFYLPPQQHNKAF